MTEEADRAWALMKSISFAMLITRGGDKLDARPMSASVEQAEGRIYFLTDVRHHKDHEIKGDSRVSLSFAHPGDQKYVWTNGIAQVSDDRAKIKELFSLPAKAWWESADDPNLRLLTFTPEQAEYWDSPGKAVSYVKMLAAALTSSRPEMGDNKRTDL
jgi:general stress protein 26